MIDRLISPNQADVFITYTTQYPEDVDRLQQVVDGPLSPYVKAVVNNSAEENHARVMAWRDERIQVHRQRSKYPDHEHAMYQWYNLRTAFQSMAEYERQHGFQYDVVVRIRTDLRPREVINLSELGITDDVVYTCSDLVIIGTRDNMEIIVRLTDIYYEFDIDDGFFELMQIPRDDYSSIAQWANTPEYQLFRWIRDNGLTRVEGRAVDLVRQ